MQAALNRAAFFVYYVFIIMKPAFVFHVIIVVSLSCTSYRYSAFNTFYFLIVILSAAKHLIFNNHSTTLRIRCFAALSMTKKLYNPINPAKSAFRQFNTSLKWFKFAFLNNDYKSKELNEGKLTPISP